MPHSRFRLIPIILGQLIGFACGVASLRLNSHFVPPTVLGAYGLFLTFTPIGVWVLYAGLLKFIARQWAASHERGDLLREVAAVWARRLPWLALLSSIAALMMERSGIIAQIMLGLALFFSAACLALAAFAQAALQAERAHWRDCLVVASGSLTRSFLPPLLYTSMGGLTATLWLGVSIHALTGALIGIWALRTSWTQNSRGTSAGRELTPVYEGSLFITVAFAGWLLTGLNRWLIAWQFGKTEAGYYTLAGGGAIIVTSMLGTVVMQYLQPGLFALGDGPAETRPLLARRIDASVLVFSGLAVAALLAITLLYPRLIGPLISPEYRDALKWVFPAGCFGIATMTAIFYHTMLLAGRREWSCGVVDLVNAAVLAGGCVVAALLGRDWLARWLIVTPVVPWLLTRNLARYYFFRPVANPTP
jgi:hypothetical protein